MSESKQGVQQAEKVIEGNKFIAEFMGAKNSTHWKDATTYTYQVAPTEHASFNWILEGMQYHSSWDWLMSVVEKIETLHDGVFSFFIVQTECDIALSSKYKPNGEDWYAPKFAQKAGNKLKSTWLAVVEFIKWYESQNKKQ